jgi:hypothetical protein
MDFGAYLEGTGQGQGTAIPGSGGTAVVWRAAYHVITAEDVTNSTFAERKGGSTKVI